MRQNYLGGNYGYGHIKTAIFELILEKYNKERALYNAYMANPLELDNILAIGETKAKKIALQTLSRVREVLGF